MSGIFSLGRLVSLVTIGGTVASAAAIHRLLSQVVSIISLAVITSLMIGALMVVGLYTTYRIAVLYGVEPFTALASIYGLTLVVTGSLIYVLVMKLKGIKAMPDLTLQSENPVVERVQTIAQSFMDGLKTPREPKYSDAKFQD